MNHGIIKVTEKQSAEIEAYGAKLYIYIHGENLVYGNAALEKSVEVKVVGQPHTFLNKRGNIS